MAIESAQSLIEMSAKNLPGSKKRPERRYVNLTAICQSTV
jgi:hypothetical protein